jgi:hypothetical protein
VTLYEGRLFWAGLGEVWGSVVDSLHSFDLELEGDAGPILRTLGLGPTDRVNWLVGQQRLLIGTQGAELSVRSSNDNEPLTPTNFTIKDPSTQGSANVGAAKVDSATVFVQRGRTKVFELNYEFEPNDYAARELTILASNIGESNLNRIAVQRQPDTRIHVVRGDGKVAMCLFNKAEELICWVLVETDGKIEEVATLPGVPEDIVYYVVKRTIAGVTTRQVERWAIERDCAIWSVRYEGASATVISVANENGVSYVDDTKVTVRDANGTKIGLNLTVTDGSITLASAVTYAHITPSLCKHADSFIEVTNVTPSVTLSGLSLFTGEPEVVVWADGKDFGSFDMTGLSAITLPEAVELAVVGLPYEANFRSAKLAFASETGTALSQVKRVTQLGVIGAFLHNDGLEYGNNFTTMYTLPQVIDGTTTDAEHVHDVYDQRMIMFPGVYDTDARLCLRATAPRPATVLAGIIGMETVDTV